MVTEKLNTVSFNILLYVVFEYNLLYFKNVI